MAEEEENLPKDSKEEPSKPVDSQPLQQPAKKSNAGLVVLVIVITAIVVAGLIIGGWYGYKYYKNKTTKTTSSATSTSTVTTTTTSTTSSTGTTSKNGTMPTNGYIIEDSNTRVISESELTNLTPWQLKVARNEIYARHGRPFVHKDLQCYFAKQSWYKQDPNFSESSLSAVEKKNVETIKAYEIKTNSPLYQKDSGC